MVAVVLVRHDERGRSVVAGDVLPQGGAEARAMNDIPRRSPTGGLPPLGPGTRLGSSGSMIAQSSSDSRGLAMVVISRVTCPGDREAIAMPSS